MTLNCEPIDEKKSHQFEYTILSQFRKHGIADN